MPSESRFPYRLQSAFFITLHFERKPEVPVPLQLTFGIYLKVVDEKFPDNLQINLKVETTGDDPPVKLVVETVGLFALIENLPKPNKDIITPFLNERALFILWPYLSQIVRQMTALMGIQAIDILMPNILDTPSAPQ